MNDMVILYLNNYKVGISIGGVNNEKSKRNAKTNNDNC